MHRPLHKQGMKILPLIFVRLRQPLRHSITMQFEDKWKAVQTVVGLHGAGTVVVTAARMQHLIDGLPYLDAKRHKLLLGLVILYNGIDAGGNPFLEVPRISETWLPTDS